MSRTVIGILAHVDAGKTTLSEAMLFKSGSIGKWEESTNQDAFWTRMPWRGPAGSPLFFQTGTDEPG